MPTKRYINSAPVFAGMAPRCELFRKCNGCTSQHIDYAVQLGNKAQILERAAKSKPVVFSGPEYGARTRMDFLWRHNSPCQRTSTGTIPVVACPIATKEINTILSEAIVFAKNEELHHVRFCVIRSNGTDSSISFGVNEGSSSVASLKNILTKFAKVTSAKNVLLTLLPIEIDESTSENYTVLKGNDYMTEQLLDKAFKFSVQGFFQNNHIVAEMMHKYVHEVLSKYNTNKAHLLDLYAGVGTFGTINAELFSSVTVVESVKTATDYAQTNMKENKIINGKIICLDAKNLKRLDFSKPLFVIIDPPRSGMDEETIIALKKLEPDVIVYVSCNPVQLGKDIPKFKNYTVKSAALFDLFPQTNHFESVVELVKNNNS